MLSKASLLILGLINQEEINAYELIKVMKEIQICNWFQIADSTVYVTIRNLDKAGLINGYTTKDNNMPEKTYYTMTKRGKEELIDNIKNIISSFSYDAISFSIATFFITILDKDEIMNLFKIRLDLLMKYKEGIESQIQLIEKDNVSIIYLCNVKRNSMIVDNEINITKIYMNEIEKMEKWDIEVLKRML